MRDGCCRRAGQAQALRSLCAVAVAVTRWGQESCLATGVQCVTRDQKGLDPTELDAGCSCVPLTLGPWDLYREAYFN